MSLKNDMYVQLYDEYDEHRKHSSEKIERLEKETIELKDSAECEKYVVAKLTEEIIDLRKERDLYREALKKYETMSASVQNLDMAAREALTKGREITGSKEIQDPQGS